MTLRGHARTIFAVIFLEIVIPVVESSDEMRSCACRHPAPDPAIVQNDYVAARPCQRIGN